MATRIRAYDWTTTPLGPLSTWPQRLQAAVDLILPNHFPMAVLWGPDRILLYNDAHRDLMGDKHPSGLGQPAQVSVLELWPLATPIHEQVWAGESVMLEDAHYPVRRSGTLQDAWFTLSYSPLCDDAGTIVGILVTVFETTQRVQTEAQLRASEERLRHIVEQATDYAIFTTDPEGIIESWSAGAEIVFGWTAEDAIGQPFTMTYTPKDRAEQVPEQELHTAREQGSAPNIRWHLRQDGRYVFIYGVARARVAEDGTFLGLLKIGQDVTESILAEDRRREEEVIQREDLEAEVTGVHLDLRALSRRLLIVQEEERRRLALELHDEIGQVLTGLTFQLAAAHGQRRETALNEANTTVQKLTEQVRQLALDLRPQVLDRYGLLVAVQWHIERFQATTGITIHLRELEVAQQRFAPEIEIAAFRIVQEALTNIARYAEVEEAWVTLIRDDSLLLVIHDQGRGFDPSHHRESSGVGGMRERLALLGGHFSLETAPGQGVHITAEFLLDAGELRNATEESAS